MKIASWLSVFGSIVSATIPLTCPAASFDCSKARSALEKTICASPQLDEADARMGDVYRAALKNFPISGFVQATQKAFLKGTYAGCFSSERSGHTDPVTACLKVVEERIGEIAGYQQVKVYSNVNGKYYPEDIVFMVYSQAGKTRLRYYGSWMPDAYKPAPFPDGHICDDDNELKSANGTFVLDVIDQVPIEIQEDKLILGDFISCSPRTGIGKGEYKRVK